MKGSFDLAAGVFGKPLIEQVLEGNEIGQALFGVLILSNGDIADLLFREEELQIVVHHNVLAPKAAQVFGHDTVDLAGLYIVHHPLETGPFEIGAAPAIVYIFGENVQAVFGGILTQDGSLGFNADTVAEVFVVPAEAHI